MRGGMTDLRKIAALADTLASPCAASVSDGCAPAGPIERHLVREHGADRDLWVDPPEIANGVTTAPGGPGTAEIPRRGAEVQDLAGTVFGPTVLVSQGNHACSKPGEASVCLSATTPRAHHSYSRTTASSEQPAAVSGHPSARSMSQNDHRSGPFEALFGANGWGDMCATASTIICTISDGSEALGVARGNAVVRFGGDKGREIAIAAGDVAILPAGTGHHMLSPAF